MKKYLILLLISILSLGILSCGKSKDKTDADKQSTSNYPDPTDEKRW